MTATKIPSPPWPHGRSCELNRVLVDTQILHALYKKHQWLVRGVTFHQLHLLLDTHAGEQLELVDDLAERVQTLGGIAVGDLRDVAEVTRVPRAPDGAEEVPAMLSRLTEAHEIIFKASHVGAWWDDEIGHDGTSDLLGSGVNRTRRAAGVIPRRASGRYAAGVRRNDLTGRPRWT